MRLAQAEFDAFLTMDRGIEHQQNLEGLELAIVVLRARSNSIEDIVPLVEDVKEALGNIRPGAVVTVPVS